MSAPSFSIAPLLSCIFTSQSASALCCKFTRAGPGNCHRSDHLPAVTHPQPAPILASIFTSNKLFACTQQVSPSTQLLHSYHNSLLCLGSIPPTGLCSLRVHHTVHGSSIPSLTFPYSSPRTPPSSLGYSYLKLPTTANRPYLNSATKADQSAAIASRASDSVSVTILSSSHRVPIHFIPLRTLSTPHRQLHLTSLGATQSHQAVPQIRITLHPCRLHHLEAQQTSPFRNHLIYCLTSISHTRWITVREACRHIPRLVDVSPSCAHCDVLF